MQPEGIELKFPTPCLTSLDSALQSLGMLAATTNSRHEYLNEVYHKPYLNMVKINTHYVSNVSIGFRVRPFAPHVRYKPYTIRERHRTKSENRDSDTPETLSGMSVNNVRDDCEVQLKKAKSLENIAPEDNAENLAQNSIEAVSNCIQNLTVRE